MKEILLAILLPQLFILPLILAVRASKRGGGGMNTGETKETADEAASPVQDTLQTFSLTTELTSKLQA